MYEGLFYVTFGMVPSNKENFTETTSSEIDIPPCKLELYNEPRHGVKRVFNLHFVRSKQLSSPPRKFSFEDQVTSDTL